MCDREQRIEWEQPLRTSHVWKGRAAGTSFTGSRSHSRLLQGNGFGKRKNLQNRKTKPANTLLTAEPSLHPGQKKRSNALERFCFLSLLGKGNTTSQTKVPEKDYLFLSSSIWMVNVMPMFINPRVLKRFLKIWLKLVVGVHKIEKWKPSDCDLSAYSCVDWS